MVNNPFVVDADSLKFDDNFSAYFYKNHIVDTFLISNDIHCVASPKGIGKTLLLKAKRKACQEISGMNCLPENEMLDVIPKIIINKNLVNKLNNYHVWVDLWEICIALSVLKYQIKKNMYFYDKICNYLNNNYLSLLNNPLYNTTGQYLSFILRLSNKEFGYIMDNMQQLITAISASTIINQFSLFIDSIDERFDRCIFIDEERSDNPDMYEFNKEKINIWYYSQYSLLEAICSLRKVNHHIKIYCSVRQEVLNNKQERYNTGSHEHISGIITVISYSYTDLSNMIGLYIKQLDDSMLHKPKYKISDWELSLFGFKLLSHTFVENETENPFHYIYRHTLKRPRDLMRMFSAIYKAGKDNYNSEDALKKIINEEAVIIAKDYMNSISPFIIDFDVKKRDEFFSLLTANIFDRKELKNICSQFNSQDCPKINCKTCDKNHPFCTLYNAGLLGYVKNDYANNKKEQFFLAPGNEFTNNKSSLHISDLYFLHPSINELIKIKDIRKNINLKYNFCKDFIIGDGRSIDNQKINNSLTNMRKNKTIFLSSSDSGAMKYIRADILRYLEDDLKFENILAFEKDDFPKHDFMTPQEMCIKNVELCDVFILIIDQNMGSPYKGKFYENEFSKAFPNQTITSVWAECYNARKHKKNILLFIEKDLVTMYHAYMANIKSGILDSKMGKVEYPETMSAFLHYLQNHNGDATWRNEYSDLFEFKTKLEKELLKSDNYIIL